MRRVPAGVAVVTVDVGGQPAGLTVASLVSLSLEPPLVGFAIRRDAALHELLRESGELAVSILAAGAGAPRPALRPRRAADRALGANPAPRGRRGPAAARRMRPGGCAAASPTSSRPATTPSSSRPSRRPSPARRERARSSSTTRPTPRCDRGGRLRPRRRAARLRAGLGRGPRAARRGARRPLARPGAAGHDGHELDGVVALHARDDRPARAARGDQPRGGRAPRRDLPRAPSRAAGRARRRSSGSPRAGRSGSPRRRTAS